MYFCNIFNAIFNHGFDTRKNAENRFSNRALNYLRRTLQTAYELYDLDHIRENVCIHS